MKLQLSYQTQQLPPPYAYAALFTIEVNQESVLLDFQIEYLGRDGLEEEEIILEGFSNNDDFNWQGVIGKQWKKELNLFTTFSYGEEPKESDYLHVSIDSVSKGYPNEIAEATMLIQELIQAVYEASEYERTLVIDIFDKDQKKQTIEWVFRERLVKVNGQVTLDWQLGQQLMKRVYSIDFDNIAPIKKPVAKSVNLGEGVWYPIKDDSLWAPLIRYVSKLK